MHYIDARKFQSASKTATNAKMRETLGSVFVITALCNPVFRYTFHLHFYKNMFYKKNEADICEILRIF